MADGAHFDDEETATRTGIVMTARPGVEDLAARAEQLGFSSIATLAGAGLAEIVIQPVVDPAAEMVELAELVR